MRRLLALFFLALFVAPVMAYAALSFPPLTGLVVDNAHALSPNTVEQLTSELAALESKTGDQVVVVTIPDLQGRDIAEYGYQLGRAWGIGQKGKNNGALIMIAPQEHKTRIDVGYGLEGVLTDAASSIIINQYMLPAFRNGDYNKGIADGTRAVTMLLGGDASVVSTPVVAGEQKAHSFNWIFWVILILYFLFFRSRRRSPMLGPFIAGTMLGRSGGGGFGGRGFRGGGGGFGGGGASGSW